MDVFLLCPQLASYSFSFGQNILEQQISAGPPRQRVNFVGAVHQVSASVFCRNEYDVEYFWAFYRKRQRNPSPWLWMCKTDGPDMELHECRFVVGPPQESDRQGKKVRYSFQLWVTPLSRPAHIDDEIIDFWNAGLNPDAANLFEKLANEDIPEAMKRYTRR